MLLYITLTCEQIPRDIRGRNWAVDNNDSLMMLLFQKWLKYFNANDIFTFILIGNNYKCSHLEILPFALK